MLLEAAFQIVDAPLESIDAAIQLPGERLAAGGPAAVD
jgi:hypothetical protein